MTKEEFDNKWDNFIKIANDLKKIKKEKEIE